MACAWLTEVPDQTIDDIRSYTNGPEGNALATCQGPTDSFLGW